MQAPDIAAWPPLAGPAARLAPTLLDWASREDAGCPRVCLVSGGRGTGKSHLLAWLLAGSDTHPATTVHATVPARGQTAQTLAWELGRQLGYGPLDVAELLGRVSADPRAIRMLVPDLHLAGRGPADLPTATPQAVVDELLRPLLAMPGVRAAVEVEHGELLPVPGALVLALPPGDAVPTPPLRPLPPLPDDWRTAPAPIRETALDQALQEGTAPRLLADPGFLVHGSAVAITATLADRRVTAPGRLRSVWAQAGPALASGDLSDPQRAAVLHAAALGRDPRLAEFLRPLAETHAWTAVWSRPRLRTTAVTITAEAVTAETADSFVAVDRAGRLQRHDLADGALRARITTDPRHRASRLAGVDDDHVLAVDATGRLYPMSTRPEAVTATPAWLERLARHHNAAVLATPAGRATAVAADGDSVVVADAQGGFHYWPAVDASTGPVSERPHRTAVTAVACLAVPEVPGLTLVLTGGLDGTVRLWDSASGRSMPEPVDRRNALPTALAAARTGHGPVLAVAWSDRLLHIWRLFEGRVAAVPLLQDVDTLALAPSGLLVCGGPEGSSALRLDLDAFWA
ncbi:hypothetical protein ABIA33_001038 [Streptacidiphilus sp. MAP12-16]|uniref:hypothetical protein n=1 Tax=Streptacidiphilus sp. MAP12-16 TaxID=3156300 RepID=UPI003518760F